MKVRKVVYPGTFDPITNGHYDLVVRATKLFDEVIVAVADQPSKVPIFSHQERIELVSKVIGGLTGVSVIGFDNLLIDVVKKNNAQAVIRGLRAVSDFEFEFQLASMNRNLSKSQVETIFLTPSEENAFISASLIKEVAKLGGDVSPFTSPLVQRALKLKYPAKNS